MQEERLKILEMLQEGKISAEEAADLLRKLPERGRREKGQQYAGQDSQHTSGGGLFGWIRDHIGGGPRISLDLQSSPVGQGIAALRLSGKNDAVNIEGYRGDCIKIHCSYIAKSEDPQIRLHEENGVYELHYYDNALKALKITCRVPMVMINEIRAHSINGRVKIENVEADIIEAETGNAAVSIEDVKCNKLYSRTYNASVSVEDTNFKDADLETTNGKVSLEDVQGVSARLQTTNAKISVEDADIAEINASTSNGSVTFEGLATGGNGKEERSIKASSSNGSITVYIPMDTGLKIEATTTNANVTCETAKPLFGEVSRQHIDAKNQAYDSGDRRISLKLSTSNAGIKVKEV